MLMGAAAFFGHCWPFYLGFKGGKGVATASGVILAVSWPAFVAAMIGFLLSVAIFRMISLGSVIGAFVLPIAYLATERRDAVVLPQLAWLTFFTFVTILVIARHRTNIIRIVEGQEPRVGRKAP
jgi:glycerol-3-phosphate acyltransferase PlsY